VSEVSANELLNELERNLNSQHTLLGKDMNDVNTGHDINNQNHIIDNESKFIEDYDIIWLCNPNNPTGKVFKSDYLKELIEKTLTSSLLLTSHTGCSRKKRF
jgi:Histidinol-phosphate/aromatic aminotransferase and cobyric acid decarboxylase